MAGSEFTAFSAFLVRRLNGLLQAEGRRLSRGKALEAAATSGAGLLTKAREFDVRDFGLTPVETDLKLLRQLAAVGRQSISADVHHRLLFEIAQRRGWLGETEFRSDWLL
jgi:hypothetical protein